MTSRFKTILRFAAVLGFAALLSGCYYHPGPTYGYRGHQGYGGQGYGHEYGHGHGPSRHYRHYRRGY